MSGPSDYTRFTGAEVLDRLAKLSARKRRSLARSLIYKKGRRPAELSEQIVLLDALRAEQSLTDFDRFYALVAGGHKVSEEVLTEEAVRWLDRILEAEEQMRAMPIAYGLRKDRTHLVFSAMNVALNLDLLTGSRHAERLGNWFSHEVKTLEVRRMTPYLFNSTSNTVKCAGLVLLSKPELAAETADLMRRLVSYSIEINNPVHWWIYSRFKAPVRLADVTERAAFGSFCNTMRRLRAIEDVAAATTAEERRRALRETAETCVAQAKPRQKAALLEKAEILFGQRADLPTI